MNGSQFPSGFVWGTATAAYQVEGAVAEDGRVPSIWDTYCEQPGNIVDHSSGAVACDQYHRYAEDIGLMKQLGVSAYRLSIAWPRIVPEPGKVNDKGIEHYVRLLDALRDAGIKPVVTLYHWDLPQWAQDRGGWENRDVSQWFAEYAAIMAHALGEKVDTWTTLNEPFCVAFLGYGSGVHAPGISSDLAALKAVHHLNLAHGLAVEAVRAELGDGARLSVTLNLPMAYPASDSAADREATEHRNLMTRDVFLGPMLEGRYDPRIIERTRAITDWSFVHDGDLAVIKQRLANLGVNFYSTDTVRRRPGIPLNALDPRVRRDREAIPAVGGTETLAPTGELTAMGWNQDPRGLTDLLVGLSRRFPDLPLVVTENGSAWDDEVGDDGLVHDAKRVSYLERHIKAVAEALRQGADVRGYYAWSLLDNFEWAWGYTKRFGLIRVDYGTQRRIWKDSARWYSKLVQSGVIPPDGYLQ